MKMMNSGFNSNTEISLRILLSLYASEEHLSVDELAIRDFMTVYAKDFGITAYNLHGDNKSNLSLKWFSTNNYTKNASIGINTGFILYLGIVFPTYI